MAKDRNTMAKRQREVDKRQKQMDKRDNRERKKTETNVATGRFRPATTTIVRWRTPRAGDVSQVSDDPRQNALHQHAGPHFDEEVCR